jgi:hypothetical protein
MVGAGNRKNLRRDQHTVLFVTPSQGPHNDIIGILRFPEDMSDIILQQRADLGGDERGPHLDDQI